MITYNTRLVGTKEDLDALRQLLEWHKLAFNAAAEIQFDEPKLSIVVLHTKFYSKFRKIQPQILSQVLIRGEQECLSAYRSIKSNRHKIKSAIVKKNLSMRLDKRLYRKVDLHTIRVTTSQKRKTFNFVLYPKLQKLLETTPHSDPLIYENNGELYISFSFETKKEQLKQRLALGVDLGIRRTAACSDGRIIQDKKFNADKRKLRYLKRQLQSKGTKSARRHLKKLRRKERNKNKNQTHLVANTILNTDADTIALENLKSIKRKKTKYQNKNAISQVPFYELRRVVTYKAQNQGKTVLLVSPSYTSQNDCVTGNREGERRGCRFYSKSGLVYDADTNASINIAKFAKLPISQTQKLTYGQVAVTQPIVCKSAQRGLTSP
jgi:IS605 OrfB family transposase